MNLSLWSILLILLWRDLNASICTRSNANYTTTQNLRYTNANNLSNEGQQYRVKIGPISGYAYKYGWHKPSGNNYPLLIKSSEDNTIIWYKVYNEKGGYYAFDVSPTEDYLYYLQQSYSSVNLYKVDANNGEIDSKLKISTIVDHEKSNLAIDPSNQALFINVYRLGANSGTDGAVILKWDFTQTSFSYASYDKTFDAAKGIVVFSDTEIFYQLNEDLATDVHHLIKASMTNNELTEIWNYKIVCPTSTCISDMTLTGVNEVDNTMWHHIPFGDKQIIIEQDIDTGTQIGSRHLLRVSSAYWIGNDRGAAFSNGVAYFGFSCSSIFSLISINSTTQTIINAITDSTSGDAKIRGLYSQNGLVYVMGYISVGGVNYGYYSRVSSYEITQLEPFVEDTHINLEEITNTLYELIDTSTSTVITNDVTSYSLENVPSEVSGFTLGEDPSSTISDVSYSMLDPISAENIISGYNSTISVEMPCSISGSTVITYNLNSNNAIPLPDWITYDETSFEIAILQPNVTEDTYYDIIVEAAIGASIYQRQISLTILNCQVTNCQVTNCQLWESNYESKCHTWNSGYELTDALLCSIIDNKPSDNSTKPEESKNPEKPKFERSQTSSSYATQSVASAGIASSLASSSASGGSPQGAWIMINQFQIFILIPLISKNLPDKLVNYILGMDMAMFNFNSIPLKEATQAEGFLTDISFDQPNEYLEEIGLDSGSTIINIFSLIFMIWWWTILHLLFVPLYYKIRNKTGFIAKIAKYVWKMATFSFYIRLITESFMILWISSFSEIKYYSDKNYNSLIIDSIILLIIIWFIVLSLYIWYKNKDKLIIYQDDNFREFYAGLKGSGTLYSSRNIINVNKYINRMRLVRLYFSIFLLRRLLLTFMILFLEDVNYYVKLSSIILLQTVYIVFLFMANHFESLKDNIAEKLNELIFLAIIISMLFLKNKEDWNNSLAWVYISIFMLNSIIVTTMYLITGAISIFKKFKKCLNKKSSKIHPINTPDTTNRLQTTEGNQYIDCPSASSQHPSKPSPNLMTKRVLNPTNS